MYENENNKNKNKHLEGYTLYSIKGTYALYIKTICSPRKSRETIPLKEQFHVLWKCFDYFNGYTLVCTIPLHRLRGHTFFVKIFAKTKNFAKPFACSQVEFFEEKFCRNYRDTVPLTLPSLLTFSGIRVSLDSIIYSI